MREREILLQQIIWRPDELRYVVVGSFIHWKLWMKMMIGMNETRQSYLQFSK